MKKYPITIVFRHLHKFVSPLCAYSYRRGIHITEKHTMKMQTITMFAIDNLMSSLCVSVNATLFFTGISSLSSTILSRFIRVGLRFIMSNGRDLWMFLSVKPFKIINKKKGMIHLMIESTAIL